MNSITDFAIVVAGLVADDESFWDAFFDAEIIFSVDLMAANPDIAAQVSMGLTEISVRKFAGEEGEVFAAFWDNGSDGDSLEALVADGAMAFAPTLDEAQGAADKMIMQWKRNWNLA